MSLGIDDVSRRKGQVYLTVVYDLERRVLLWVGDDRTEEAVRPYFTEEMGRRRCHTLQLFDRFHIVKHLNEAVEEVRRSEMRRLSQNEKVACKRCRCLLLKNPWNLSDDQKERLWCGGTWRSCFAGAWMGFWDGPGTAFLPAPSTE